MFAERFLIAPTTEELRSAMDNVLTRANACSQLPPLCLTSDLFQTILQRLGTTPTGDECWNESVSETQVHTALRVTWVSDYGQRQHFRIQALPRRLDQYGIPILSTMDASRVPEDIVYVQYRFTFTPPNSREPILLVACPCGVVGTPNEIAWMGDRCGPCHDRSESGEPLPDSMARHLRNPAFPGSSRTLGRTLSVLPDGNHALVLRPRQPDEIEADPNSLVLWDLVNQREEYRWSISGGNLGVNLSPDGETLGVITPVVGGVVLRVFDWPSTNPRRESRIPGEARCFTLAPQGQTAYMGNRGEITWVNLALLPPSFKTLISSPEDDPLDLTCSADGRWLAIYWRFAGIVLLDRVNHQPVASFQMPADRTPGVLVITPDSRLMIACDSEGRIWFFEIPTLRLLGHFQTDRLTINGMDVCGPWLMLLALGADPIRSWPWQILTEYSQNWHKG